MYAAHGLSFYLFILFIYPDNATEHFAGPMERLRCVWAKNPLRSEKTLLSICVSAACICVAVNRLIVGYKYPC